MKGISHIVMQAADFCRTCNWMERNGQHSNSIHISIWKQVPFNLVMLTSRHSSLPNLMLSKCLRKILKGPALLLFRVPATAGLLSSSELYLLGKEPLLFIILAITLGSFLLKNKAICFKENTWQGQGANVPQIFLDRRKWACGKRAFWWVLRKESLSDVLVYLV